MNAQMTVAAHCRLMQQAYQHVKSPFKHCRTRYVFLWGWWYGGLPSCRKFQTTSAKGQNFFFPPLLIGGNLRHDPEPIIDDGPYAMATC